MKANQSNSENSKNNTFMEMAEKLRFRNSGFSKFCVNYIKKRTLTMQTNFYSHNKIFTSIPILPNIHGNKIAFYSGKNSAIPVPISTSMK